MALLRPRLALRIYLVGLVQFALVLLGFALLMWTQRATAENLQSDARAAVDRIVRSLGDPDALARELERIGEVLDASITVYDGSGKVLATNRRGDDIEPPAFAGPPHTFPAPPPGFPASPPHFRARAKGLVRAPFADVPAGIGFGDPPLMRPGGPPMLAFMMPVELPDGPGRVFFAARNPRPPFNGYLIAGFVLVVVGLASFFTARSLAKPLTRLSAAAERFGAGELETRVRLERADEIGEVARAFDEMAERIAHLVRAEKELMANVSHELRTPLARIRVALDLAAEGDANVARQSLREIAEDLGELEQLISDVLVASRLDLARLGSRAASGGFPLHKERVSVFELLEKTAARFRTAHPERPLVVETAGHEAKVEGDAVLLRRALSNLLENAHKYTSDPNAPIGLVSGADPSFVFIEVRDQGIGIAPDDVRHVFLPFFRSDRSRTRATGGFGLGLSIVKQIAEAHQGNVEIESQIGAGTRVRLRLPCVMLDSFSSRLGGLVHGSDVAL